MPKTKSNGTNNESDRIRAVIPAAGCGSRLLPLTLVTPKELFPLRRRPMIHIAVEEAISSGIEDIAIVIRRGKEVIRCYFDALMSSSEPALSDQRSILSRAKIRYVFQEKPIGIGNAIFESRHFIDDDPFVLIIPDQFLDSGVPALRQLLDATHKSKEGVWSSLIVLPPEKDSLFPGARVFDLANRKGDVFEVRGIKDITAGSPDSLLRAFGRTYFPRGVSRFFSDRFLNPATGENDLLLTFQALMHQFSNFAVILKGAPMDFGTWAGYEHFFSRLR